MSLHYTLLVAFGRPLAAFDRAVVDIPVVAAAAAAVAASVARASVVRDTVAVAEQVPGHQVVLHTAWLASGAVHHHREESQPVAAAGTQPVVVEIVVRDVVDRRRVLS